MSKVDLKRAASAFRAVANRPFFLGTDAGEGFADLATAAEGLLSVETRVAALEAKLKRQRQRVDGPLQVILAPIDPG